MTHTTKSSFYYIHKAYCRFDLEIVDISKEHFSSCQSETIQWKLSLKNCVVVGVATKEKKKKGGGVGFLKPIVDPQFASHSQIIPSYPATLPTRKSSLEIGAIDKLLVYDSFTRGRGLETELFG